MIFSIIHPFLTKFVVSDANPLSNVDVIDVPSVRFVMRINIKGNVGSFAPFTI